MEQWFDGRFYELDEDLKRLHEFHTCQRILLFNQDFLLINGFHVDFAQCQLNGFNRENVHEADLPILCIDLLWEDVLNVF